MSTAAQQGATRNYRARPAQREVKRSDVLVPETDPSLTSTLGQPLSEDARETVKAPGADDPSSRGGIFFALRRSPLVGADLDLSRSRIKGRNFDL